MTVNIRSSQARSLPSSIPDKISVVKGWVHGATDLFIRFCINEPTWTYLGRDQNNLRPYLEKIHEFCITQECSHISEDYLKNISAILQRDPFLIGLYIRSTEEISSPQTNLLKSHFDITHQITENHSSDLLKTHFQAIQKATKLRLSLLETYLRIVKKHTLNSTNNLLTHHICGSYTSFNILEKHADLKELFFQGVDSIWSSRPELLEFYLQNIHILCNFFNSPLIMERYLTTCSEVFTSNTPIFELHISNVNSIQLPFLQDYINITFYLRNALQILELYIESVGLLKKKFSWIKTHQQNTKAICELQYPILETYFVIALHLKDDSHCILDYYIRSVKRISSNLTDLKEQLQTMNIIYRFKPELLEPHLQNVCKLRKADLHSYSKIIYGAGILRDGSLERFIYRMYNTIHLSDLQPSLLKSYFLTLQKWEKNPLNILCHSYNIYSLIKKDFTLLPVYLETILFLEETLPNLSQTHLENASIICRDSFYFLSEYLSTIMEFTGIEGIPFLLFYITKTHNIHVVIERYFELSNIYHDIYEMLESVPENLFCYVCNFRFISQKFPNLIKDYLESVSSLQNIDANLSGLHLQNIKNICFSEPNFLNTYFCNITNSTDNQTNLKLHLQNASNKYSSP